ncbi:exported hypothetical protein [Plantibacter sp. T3]|nr:exported hypothetical protein [Plantibacter sp. T3]
MCFRGPFRRLTMRSRFSGSSKQTAGESKS